MKTLAIAAGEYHRSRRGGGPHVVNEPWNHGECTGNHPHMALFQISDILQVTHMYIYIYILCVFIHHPGHMFRHLFGSCYIVTRGLKTNWDTIHVGPTKHIQTLDEIGKMGGELWQSQRPTATYSK